MACAICARPVDPRYRPFCSKRCADIDLAKWLRGDYVVPGEPVEDLPPRDEEPAPRD
ncbi:DNA gyrase inhibitor YacG [Paracoccus sp. NSM]|uniref:DNA gyrase inhibitor YacG n=1 Tax=Paracoccus sp. NSM TaxID=3457784 RepID=UPI0040368716